jgi:hypothetical protein
MRAAGQKAGQRSARCTGSAERRTIIAHAGRGESRSTKGHGASAITCETPSVERLLFVGEAGRCGAAPLRQPDVCGAIARIREEGLHLHDTHHVCACKIHDKER